MAVSPESVASAADGLLAQGRKPTLRAVREALGGGSLRDHRPHCCAVGMWSRRLRAQAAQDIPAAVRDAAGCRPRSQMWQSALAAGEQARRDAFGALQCQAEQISRAAPR